MITEIFDFDGTLVDLWPRYYNVFCTAADTNSVSFLHYREVKRRYRRDDLVAEALGLNLPDHYYDLKRELLESRDYLAMDTAIPDPRDFSEYFNVRNCIMLTKRRIKQNLLEELERLGFYLDENRVHVLSPECQKKNWLYSRYMDRKTILIGDGEDELEAARALQKCRLYFVDSGLVSYQPVAGDKNVKLIRDVNEYLLADEEM